MTFTEIIREIKKIISDKYYFKVEFYHGELAFCIYDTDLMISYISKNDDIYFNSEFADGNLSVKIMEELATIMKLLEQNKSVLKYICE